VLRRPSGSKRRSSTSPLAWPAHALTAADRSRPGQVAPRSEAHPTPPCPSPCCRRHRAMRGRPREVAPWRGQRALPERVGGEFVDGHRQGERSAGRQDTPYPRRRTGPRGRRPPTRMRDPRAPPRRVVRASSPCALAGRVRERERECTSGTRPRGPTKCCAGPGEARSMRDGML